MEKKLEIMSSALNEAIPHLNAQKTTYFILYPIVRYSYKSVGFETKLKIRIRTMGNKVHITLEFESRRLTKETTKMDNTIFCEHFCMSND